MKKIRSCEGCKHRKLRSLLFLARPDWCKLNKCTCDQARYGHRYIDFCYRVFVIKKPKCTLKTKIKKTTTLRRKI